MKASKSFAFHFKGSLPLSKSLLNRQALIFSHSAEPPKYTPKDEDGKDVHDFFRLLQELRDGAKEFHCGEGAMGFRFFVGRASRIPGDYRFYLPKSLDARPQGELINLLSQLGVLAEYSRSVFSIKTQGWKLPTEGIKVSSSQSSQFLSTVLLNAWHLERELKISWGPDKVSWPYFTMSQKLASHFGMTFKVEDGSLTIALKQSPVSAKWIEEIDMSSAFAVAALAAVAGRAEIQAFPIQSLQADAFFVEILKKMGVPIRLNDGVLFVEQSRKLCGIDLSLTDSPDLFPVLGALAVKATGPSTLRGAKHLSLKESNRIEALSELLGLCECSHNVLNDGMEIFPSSNAPASKIVEYDPRGDHRMVMSAQVLKWAGYPIRILGVKSVGKSFPGFSDLLA